MFGPHKYIVAGVAVALAAVLILVKKNGVEGAGVAVGEAAADAVGGVVSGAAQGVGDWFGLPRTDETECEKAMREGRYWDASFVCPAGDFIGGTTSDAIDSLKDLWGKL